MREHESRSVANGGAGACGEDPAALLCSRGLQARQIVQSPLQGLTDCCNEPLSLTAHPIPSRWRAFLPSSVLGENEAALVVVRTNKTARDSASSQHAAKWMGYTFPFQKSGGLETSVFLLAPTQGGKATGTYSGSSLLV